MTEEQHLESPEAEAQEQALSQVPLPVSEPLRIVARVLTDALDSAVASVAFNELTIDVSLEDVLGAFDLIANELGTEVCLDASAVHWPGGVFEHTEQVTTGWPVFEEHVDGHFDVLWLFRGLATPRTFRLRTKVTDTDPRVPSATAYWPSALFMERESWDLMGVIYEGHPDLRRIMMPDDWVGHPVRKDSPLGGVEVTFHGASVPPADERDY
ncbi:NADH-quinone oxidoreductase subunit C [Stomatohabitans albus]|uniref:NADH-quinone oxidoreductase subunit C n=1 Tax=Stomatohabitans albus TaxID=3110766 RepID=UPI00300C6E0A